MISVRLSLTGALVGLLALLAGLGTMLEIGLAAWSVGLGCGALVLLAVARGALGTGASALGPADLVTLSRATLACAIAAVVAQPFVEPLVQPLGEPSTDASSQQAVVALAVLALLLDAADGRVARRTRTSSAFGARFDGEADAFLLMVLSVYVAPSAGWWVLGIGAARYAFGAAGWMLPWMRRPLPPRYWRKVVAAVQGIVLASAAAGVAPPAVVATALGVALALLAESFGRDVLWLWSHRAAEAPVARRWLRVDRDEPVGATLSGSPL